jgi:hypothetical protein
MYRGGDGSAGKQTGDSSTPPPVPTLPMALKKRNPSRLGPVSETSMTNEQEEQEQAEKGKMIKINETQWGSLLF